MPTSTLPLLYSLMVEKTTLVLVFGVSHVQLSFNKTKLKAVSKGVQVGKNGLEQTKPELKTSFGTGNRTKGTEFGTSSG